jgi:bifunctional DNA-binding transcriptional regulator/antitoxin component of YhaV-PrlF toxin-antitoxin module
MFWWMRERLINRSRQGAIGEASAIEWLTSAGATVFVPFGPSPVCDLVALVSRDLLRIQVKTSTRRTITPNGHERWELQLATNGGNQSWTGLTKKLDPTALDFVFALVGDGRRWFIPAQTLEGERGLNLGGPKYSEFEIEPGISLDRVVYGALQEPSRIDAPARGSAGAGEPGQTVNLVPQLLSGFDSHLPHSAPVQSEARPRFRPSKYERNLGKSGRAVINQKRRVTLPQSALLSAGLRDGDQVDVKAEGPGRIVLEKAGLPVWAERIDGDSNTLALDGLDQ